MKLKRPSSIYTVAVIGMAVVPNCSCWREAPKAKLSSANVTLDHEASETRQKPTISTSKDSLMSSRANFEGNASEIKEVKTPPTVNVKEVVSSNHAVGNKAASLEKTEIVSDSVAGSADARKLARLTQKESQAAAAQGDLKTAYTKCLSAWEALQELRDDQECRVLSAELMNELKVYGEKLSSRPTGVSPKSLNKPVRFE